MLFDRDSDGVLSFTECVTALHTMGYRISGLLPPSLPPSLSNVVSPDKTVLEMVRAVSEDDIYFSIEFNEFLKMISRKEEDHLQLDCLVEAFKYISLQSRATLSLFSSELSTRRTLGS